MNASIALRTATLPVRAQATGSDFSLLDVLSKALKLARLVGDNGTVNAKTVAKVREQVLAA